MWPAVLWLIAGIALIAAEVLSGEFVLLMLGGGALAMGLGRRAPRATEGDGVIASENRARRAAIAVGEVFVRIDAVLRRWPVAGLSLLALSILFGAAMSMWR